MTDQTVEYGVLCSMFEAIVRCKKAALKRKHIRTFLEHVYTGHEHFSAMRLILPDLDKDRANYGMREGVLAKFLADALGLSKDSEDAKKLINWRKGGQRAGSNAGNFPVVAAEVLHRRQKTAPGGLKIKHVNDLLDRLAAEDREEKIAVLAELISKTNAQEMKWIITIILKDLKLGISEKTVFSEFHPDAEDYFNVTCDLKLVCEKLRDRSIRYNRQDIEVGKAVRPQLAARAANVEDAWKKMRGKEVVVECKFDGDRIQVHKNGNKLNFWSRTFTDHPEYIDSIGDVLCQHIIPEKCILDGEMLVWDRVAKKFAEFGSNREVAKAGKDGLDTGLQMCYVAFDILYDGDCSVIHRPLRERQQLLQKALRPLSGRLEILIPEAGGLNSKRAAGEPRWSILASNAEEVERFFQETIDNREEGVVLKDLDSKWEPSDRSGKWLKLKPDYIHSESDLDALIIGGYYGSGRRGGEVAQFLLGLAERPKVGGYPTKFYSFCKVGTGLTDNEAEQLVHKLKPYFRRNEKGSKPPSFYAVTNAAKERPDVWIDQPEKSVILQITSDIRTIRTETFATPYSLRFPRIQKIRHDKPWYDCLDVQTLADMVHAKSGDDGQGVEGGTQLKGRAKRVKQEKPESLRSSLVPSHMLVTDVSRVKQVTRLFGGLVFYIANTTSEHPIDKLHKLIVENGGTFSMNLNNIVTHAVASEKKGLKYQAASKNGDVIHLSWLLDCVSQKALHSVGPKYYLHMSDATKERLKSEVDEFGDFYFLDIDEYDLKQVFENMDMSKVEHDMEKVKHYAKKYCPTPTWCHFCGCCVFFLRPLHSTNEDTVQIVSLTLRRLALEVEMHEGTVSDKLTRNVTHIVVYIPSESSVSFKTILQSVSLEERRRLLSKRVKVVSHHWIEDSLSSDSCRHPAEDKYDLRAGEVLESEEEEKEEEQPAKEDKSTTLISKEDKSIIPITPDKRAVPRPPRKPIARKRAMPIGGRGRGRRGSKEEEPDEEEHTEQDRAVSKRLRGQIPVENPAGGSVPGAEFSHLDEAVGAGKKVVPRGRKRDATSDRDEYIPKRRLILDEGEVHSSTQVSERVPTPAEPPRPRMSSRLAEKRKLQESSVEDEEPVTASKREESQSTRLKDNLHRKQSLNSNELNPSLDSTDAMLNTLLPDYFASQQSGFNSTKAEETLPSTSLTLGNRMDVEESEKDSSEAGFISTRGRTLPSTSLTLGNRVDVEESEKGNSEAGFISTRGRTLPSISSSLLTEPSLTSGSRMDIDQSERSNSQASLDSTRVGAMSTEAFGAEFSSGRGISNPTFKPKRSYKDLVNQMLKDK
ncbi:hypothetical protein KC19_2G142100 [Ceratodon purpureus]|uniref:DNA ligase n=1 Tax=Ceratodon purpureus TaxID=3225 RepID=A0A8T0ITS0_CERPU|nr:hypothetical protein KC19_2G142100 [Ceratodon purpureus]